MANTKAFPRFSNRSGALANPTTHQYASGIGFVDHGAPLVAKSGPHAAGLCTPPDGTKNGSVHTLRSPGRRSLMRFVWVGAQRAWARNGGKRLAFTAEYLSRTGWTYVGPAIGGIGHPLALPAPQDPPQ